ncbi:amidohydrolase [Formosa agariphila KMM 3901]|uniref:Amidohydrolase n=1 Tax=Formosa agariphila (strain DSM 15362 / KCTC 12365 / LMG 23005 / KMM 3901 / M-2Alg 35-1) TaxID=1347342 RepID=T2KQK8_FORAG|nr:amidohydrolase family protein [Formosa agariphila]CDF81122.1 amidohydrolase [Formosa agariphila KMM 3901]
MKQKILFITLFTISNFLLAQDYFPESKGVKSNNHNYTAFTNAKIYITPTTVIESGTLLIKDGQIISASDQTVLPKNTVVIDSKNKTIYPSFIDIYSDFGIEKPKRNGRGRSSQYDATRDGFYWNDHIMPETNAIEKFVFDDKKAEELLKLGFGVVNTHLQDGIARGTGVLVALNKNSSNADRILNDRSAQYFSFTKSAIKSQSYPTSLMGATALLRQFYNDADWYAKGNINVTDRSLEALNSNKDLVQIFEGGSKSNVLRADKIGDAFGIQYSILGGGDEYEMIPAIKATHAKLILPLNFPDAYDVSDPFSESFLSLSDMRHWNQAPSNPKILAENGVVFSFTLNNLKETKDFKEKLNKAINYGLSKTKALEALTTIPAEILGQSNRIGALKKGMEANFIITSGDYFDKETIVYENWVQGKKNLIKTANTNDIRGNYTVTLNSKVFNLSIKGTADSPKATVKQDSTVLTSKFNFENNWLNLSFADNSSETYRFSSLITSHKKDFNGKVVTIHGEQDFIATLTAPYSSEKDKDEASPKIELTPVTYPNLGYGNLELPKQQTILFKNATVWTGEDDGILTNTDVLVKDGKIAKIGKDLSAGKAKVIDATGKHLTAGIIDEHSHIAALAINESGHNSSAEVTMEDVVDPDDISIYYALGGGVTSLQLLHGSANPIGGRSAILKLKWGETAENMIYDNSPKFIKFALGENVKQSNWGSNNRFPQTRMGVEQVFINYFQRAKEYGEKKKSGVPYRYDEEMETLLEILNGERFISCHSYVQSEINMLMKVAEKFNFKINTFTHILEGYKVADKMAEHGVGAATFSDWWAYKFEVNDAIPYNAAIMQQQGVTVAINSDDQEMIRRLNQEAAKTVKYGGMTELEAWKMVTINPAKLLHIDDRVGSIKKGKDADLVLWSDHPMSIYSKAEKTLIEGAIYFDIEKDKQQRKDIAKERAKLVDLMLQEKSKGKKTQKPKGKSKEEMTCESL